MQCTVGSSCWSWTMRIRNVRIPMPEKQQEGTCLSSSKKKSLESMNREKRRICVPGSNPGPNLEADNNFSAKNYWIKDINILWTERKAQNFLSPRVKRFSPFPFPSLYIDMHVISICINTLTVFSNVLYYHHAFILGNVHTDTSHYYTSFIQVLTFVLKYNNLI